MNVGMVFAMIFTLLVIGFLLIFGSGQISKMFGLSYEAQVQKTIKDIEKKVQDLYTLSEGSTLPYNLALPQGTKICFVNPEDPSPRFYSDPVETWDPDRWEQDMIKSKGYNIWYYLPNSDAGYGYTINHLRPARDSFCSKFGRRVFFINTGLWVEVEPSR